MVSNNKILGNYITRVDRRNVDKCIRNVMGISVRKEFRVPTSKVNPNELSTYKIVEPGQFAFVQTTHNEKCFAFAYNDTNKQIVVSSVNEVFYVDEKYIHPRYLQMFLNRSSFDRYARFNSWGSAREVFSWDDLCAVEIEIPPINIQRKYVDIYMAMVANQQSYERGLEDLKLVCDGYIEDLRRNLGVEPIGPYIAPIEARNTDLSVKLAQGITIEKVFASPKQVAEAKRSAKIVRNGQFAYNRATTRNGEKISIAYREGEDCVVSSAYQVFEIFRKDKLLPEYLMMWFKRSEFDRYARYMSKGSAHEFFEYSDMEEVCIPIPDIAVQKSIADIYRVYMSRKKINEQLKKQTKEICPILIRGSLEEV